MSHVSPLVFESSNKAMLDIIRITRLFLSFNEILTRPLFLWQHSCGNFYHRQIKSYIPGFVWAVCSLALPLVWHRISPLLFSELCDQIAFDVTSFFPVLFIGVPVGACEDICTLLVLETLCENVSQLDDVRLLLWSHAGDNHPVMDRSHLWCSYRSGGETYPL